jgi:hypothetical protein
VNRIIRMAATLASGVICILIYTSEALGMAADMPAHSSLAEHSAEFRGVAQSPAATSTPTPQGAGATPPQPAPTAIVSQGPSPANSPPPVIVYATPNVFGVIVPPLVAGGVGLAAAFLSYRMAERQLQRQAIENRENRSHQAFLLLSGKRFDASESIWHLLFTMEGGASLSDQQIDSYIRGVMWLPESSRERCLAVLREYLSARRGGGVGMHKPVDYKAAREELLAVLNVDQLDSSYS